MLPVVKYHIASPWAEGPCARMNTAADVRGNTEVAAIGSPHAAPMQPTAYISQNSLLPPHD